MPVEIVEQRTVGPTLGAAAIDASAWAALIGMTITAAFLLGVYRLVVPSRCSRWAATS